MAVTHRTPREKRRHDSSSLDPLETNPPRPPQTHIRHDGYVNSEFAIQPITAQESEFRHSSWAVLRSKTYEALKRVQTNSQRLDRFCNCGSGAWLYVSKTGDDLAMRCNKCKDRWCLACQRERAATITNALLSIMSARTCRFVTLTLRHSQTPLADQIDRLYRSFSTLRRRESWRENVKGGAGFLEVKIGRDNLWHVHLHLILEGRWWDQREIASEWHAVTGDSSIVDVRKITDDGEAAGYVTKYVTKPAHSDVYHSPDRLDEMIVALRGRRLCMTFGTWRGIELEPDDASGIEWQPIGSLDSLRSKAADGDPDALRWMYAAARKWPLFSAWLAPPDSQRAARS